MPPTNETKCDPQALGANCPACPLYNQAKPVPSENVRPSRLAIIAEAPGRTEERVGRPFIGPSGYVFNEALKANGIEREEVAILNTLMCRPPKKFKPAQWKAAIEACRPRLERELNAIKPTAIFALGSRALQVTTGKQKITPWYGAPIQGRYGAVLPSFHPAFVLRKPANRPIFKRWLRRAKWLSTGAYKFEWKELVTDQEKVAEALARLVLKNTPLSVDIENNPETGVIRCIGIGDEELAISVALPADPTADMLLRQLLASSRPKIFHNAQHDILELTGKGYEIKGEVHDTLLMHAVAAPQLSHRLTDVAAYELLANRWKTEFRVEGDDKGSKLDRFAFAPLEELLPYNAKDVQGTAMLYPILGEHVLKTHKGPELYGQLRQTDKVAMKMKERGVMLDRSRFQGHRDNLTKELDKVRGGFRDLEIPEEFNLGKSGQNPSISRLFFDVFKLPAMAWTDDGKPSLDSKTLKRFCAHEGGQSLPANVARLVYRYRKYTKLLSNYIDGMPADSADIVHPTWRAFGTRTGRWSATDPAAQTIPKPKWETIDGVKILVAPGMRDLFRARPGCTIVEADYSQLELRIVALLAGDKKLLEWYANGEDVHTLNAKEVFQVQVPTKQQRELAKRVVYGLNYGGSAQTIWRSLLVDFPGLPFSNVVRVVAGWFASHPAIKSWQDQQIRLARRRLYVEAPISGRRQTYHDGKIVPTEVLNFPIQSTAGDLMNLAILQISKELNWGPEGILFQVHDSAVVEGPDQDRLVSVVKRAMEQEVELMGQRTKFVVDVKVGNNWGYLEELK